MIPHYMRENGNKKIQAETEIKQGSRSVLNREIGLKHVFYGFIGGLLIIFFAYGIKRALGMA